MTTREEQIQKMVYDIVHTYSVSTSEGDSYCPFCHNGFEDGSHYEIEEIEHDKECAYVIAQRFYKEK